MWGFVWDGADLGLVRVAGLLGWFGVVLKTVCLSTGYFMTHVLNKSNVILKASPSP